MSCTGCGVRLTEIWRGLCQRCSSKPKVDTQTNGGRSTDTLLHDEHGRPLTRFGSLRSASSSSFPFPFNTTPQPSSRGGSTAPGSYKSKSDKQDGSPPGRQSAFGKHLAPLDGTKPHHGKRPSSRGSTHSRNGTLSVRVPSDNESSKGSVKGEEHEPIFAFELH